MNPLHILIVEDNPDDADLITLRLKKEGYQFHWQRVENEQDYRTALHSSPDLILSDWSLPQFSGLRALAILQEQALDIPFIIISGSIGEEAAIHSLRLGAYDYLLKDRPDRLGKAVINALDQKRLRQEAKAAEDSLRLQSAALNAAANAIIITDRDANIQWTNPAFTTLTGYTFEEAYQKNPRDLLNSGYHDRNFYNEMWSTILAGNVWRGEMINRRKNGHIYNEENLITPLKNSSGEITQFIAIKQDISERKRDENALRQYARRQEIIANLGRELSATRDLKVIYSIAERHLAELIDCPHFAIALLHPSTNVLETVYATINANAVQELPHYPLKSSIRDGRQKAVASQQPVIVHGSDAQRKTGLLALNEPTTKLQSAIYIPMLTENQVLGLIELRSYVENAYTRADWEWLNVVAHQIGLAIQNARLFMQTQQRLAELSALHAVDSMVSAHLDQHATMEVLLDQIFSQLHIDAADVLLYDENRKLLTYAVGRGFRQPAVETSTAMLGAELAGIAAQERRTVQILDLTKENVQFLQHYPWTMEEFVSYFGLPLLAGDKIIGVLELFHRSRLNPDEDWLRFLDIIGGQAAIALDSSLMFDAVQKTNVELLKAYDATIEGWSKAMDLRDKETEGHTQRVTDLTLTLARELKINESEMTALRRGALLHDIGKLGVPDNILRKPGPLTGEEWVLMRQHPEYAYQMLKPIDYLQNAIDIPYCHHEKWDGSGYPRGLKGNEIPLAARIFAIVDVWDALTSDRPYRPAWSEAQVLDYLKSQSGVHFDPEILGIFLRMCQANP